jgi:hypothetical protein
MPDDTALRQWAEDLANVLTSLEKAGNALDKLRVPPSGTSAQRLAALQRAWATLTKDAAPLLPDGDEDRRKKELAKLAETRLRRLPGTYESLLAVVEGEMNALLESGAEDPNHAVIRTADFGEWFYLIRGPRLPRRSGRARDLRRRA